MIISVDGLELTTFEGTENEVKQYCKEQSEYQGFSITYECI